MCLSITAKADDLFGDADDISSDEDGKAKKVTTEKPARTGLEDDEDGDEFDTGERVMRLPHHLGAVVDSIEVENKIGRKYHS